MLRRAQWASLLHNARENGNPSDVSAPLNIPDAQNRVSTNSAHNCHPHSTIGSKPRSEATQAHWYVLRTTYGREQKAFDYMTGKGCPAFLPMIRTVREVRGRTRSVRESRIPNMFFAYGTEADIQSFVYDNIHLPYLRFYYRYFTVGQLRMKEPLVVPLQQMETLRIICEADADDILLLHTNVEKFMEGERVRVVEGPFKGVQGVVARYKGQQRVGIVINGLLTAATTYIPSAFLMRE